MGMSFLCRLGTFQLCAQRLSPHLFNGAFVSLVGDPPFSHRLVHRLLRPRSSSCRSFRPVPVSRVCDVMTAGLRRGRTFPPFFPDYSPLLHLALPCREPPQIFHSREVSRPSIPARFTVQFALLCAFSSLRSAIYHVFSLPFPELLHSHFAAPGAQFLPGIHGPLSRGKDFYPLFSPSVVCVSDLLLNLSSQVVSLNDCSCPTLKYASQLYSPPRSCPFQNPSIDELSLSPGFCTACSQRTCHVYGRLR